MKRHLLKTDSPVFQAEIDGRKKHDIRFNDRDFNERDILVHQETEFSGAEMKAGQPLKYTGREFAFIVTYVLRGPIYGLIQGWVDMSIEPLGETFTIS
jgi:hypothetical protein